MSAPVLTPDPALDEQRRRGLRRMRTVATSLLVLAGVVYLLTRDLGGLGGYVNAGAEASMVGAIADWFAVTALFRHPLGLPVPHTALVPERKNLLGRSLRDFVVENFLQEAVIRDRIRAASPGLRLGRWVGEPANAQRVVDEASEVVSIGLRRLRDEDLAEVVREAFVPRFKAEPISPLVGSLLTEVVRDKAHHGLVDLVLDEAHTWLSENEQTVTDVVGERAPWWSPAVVNERVTRRVYVEALAWVRDIRDDPYHSARLALDDALAQLADDLLHDEATQARAESLKDRVLDHPQVVTTAVSLLDAFRRALLGALEDPAGPLRTRALEELVAFGERLQADTPLRERLEARVADLVVFVVDRYGVELAGVISATVERWDGREAADKIELHVGRDLQFIRINGTLVGGLVGVLIHAVSQLL